MVPRQPSGRVGEFRYAGGTFAFLEPDPALRFTVALPPEHRNTLLDRVAGEMRRALVFVDGVPEIPVQSWAMAIADIFDTLTAQDPPYQGTVPLERSLAILLRRPGMGLWTIVLLDLFIEARVFEWTAPRG